MQNNYKMPLQSDSLIVEVEISDLCVPLAGYLLMMTPQLEVLTSSCYCVRKPQAHAENFDDNWSETIFLFIGVWDHVWMKYSLYSSD